MSAQIRKSPKSRSSIVFCQEKSSCRLENEEATYKCPECNTNQCSYCESELHREGSQHAYHDREKIVIEKELLCHSQQCVRRNYGDIRCLTCKANYCVDCDAAFHAKSASHSKQSMKEYRKATSDMFYSAELHTVGDSDRRNGGDSETKEQPSKCAGALLINANEQLQYTGEEDFANSLHCSSNDMVKVVSIFGNTGDGKSHTLNHTFFEGNQVFTTSSCSSSCTAGVWVAHDAARSALVVDTEGLLGTTDNSNRRTRMLLKVLAVSDVVIYRTSAGRLHSDMFEFLGNASSAYKHYFLPELQGVVKRSNASGGTPLLSSAVAALTPQSLGPALIVFHETRHTDLLGAGISESADVLLRRHFGECDVSAFSSIKYVGTKTDSRGSTDFRCLLLAVEAELRNTSVRAARSPRLVYRALEALNTCFTGDIAKPTSNCFPDQYFTCQDVCLACNERCMKTMNHQQKATLHAARNDCKYVHAHDNRRFMCRKCHEHGENVFVSPKSAASNDSALFGMAKYAISGYVLECRNCGIIYRSRQHWYGNKDPTEQAVCVQICHVWPGEHRADFAQTDNAAWRLLDGVKVVADAVTSVSAMPAQLLGHWAADQVAPAYWEPNSQIQSCSNCQRAFKDGEKKHHCRSCGKGVCDSCSLSRRPVPERGWGSEPKRVCDSCCKKDIESDSAPDRNSEASNVAVRKAVENVTSALFTVAAVAIEYPADVIKGSARPPYWVPDSNIKECCVCKSELGVKLPIHHCRKCGHGVCSPCSHNKIPVLSRGWEQPVRVCDACFKEASNSQSAASIT